MMKFFLLIFMLLISSIAFATVSSNESILVEYLKLQTEFHTQSCTPGTEEKYLALDKNYRGEGNFIPFLLNEKVDLKTIQNIMPLMYEKSNWIQGQIDFVKNAKNIREARLDLDNIERNISKMQDARKKYYFINNKISKELILKDVAREFENLLLNVELLKNKIPFLLSFKFPVDHLSLRSDYDKLKNLQTKEDRSQANLIYFFRKIVQDGAYDADLIKNDSAIRSVFDTLYLSLRKPGLRHFLSENERVDFNFVIRNFDKYIAIKPELILERLINWKARNERAIAFYQDLIENKRNNLLQANHLLDINAFVEKRAQSLFALKNFVYNQEAKAYEFWSKKSELFQALYAIETILYSEVGRMDAPDALERRDVAQVVINRFSRPEYNFLSTKDSLVKHLSSDIKIEDNKWLNVLFKEGEFSFSFFYIPGNFNIYCPDMSRVGHFLRRENVRIALELLNNPRKNFKALRYFSRISMVGRIEMDSLWSDFAALSEAPGKPVKNPKKMYKLFKKNNYKLLYDFKNDSLDKSYLVVDLLGKVYDVDVKNNKNIYYYRNPHHFKYFSILK